MVREYFKVRTAMLCVNKMIPFRIETDAFNHSLSFSKNLSANFSPPSIV